MILADLAFGYKKPASGIFLKRIWQETEVLKNRIEVVLPFSDVPENVQCIIVLCGSCDTPGKSAFMRMISFNGFHGCPRCHAGKVFTYPYEENLALRTEAGYRDDLDRTKLRRVATKIVCSLTGPYLLSLCHEFAHSVLATGTAQTTASHFSRHGEASKKSYKNAVKQFKVAAAAEAAAIAEKCK